MGYAADDDSWGTAMTGFYRPPDFSFSRISLGDRDCPIVISVQRPRIALIESFLDAQECAALIEWGADRLEPATVFDLEHGRVELSSQRTSWHAKVARAQSAVVWAIETRTARLVGLPDRHGERIDVIRYQEGQAYRPHWDWFDPDSSGGKNRIAAFGQRVATVILYLNDGFDGGSTVFSRIGLTVRPRKGSALFFCNVDDKGQVSRLTLHEGAPVLAGEKWIATRWFCNQAQTGVATVGDGSSQADAGNGAI